MFLSVLPSQACDRGLWLKLNAGHSTDLLAYLAKNCRIPRIFCGGDIGEGLNTKYDAELAAATNSKVYHTMGNHDYFRQVTDNDIAYWYNSGKPEQIGNSERNYFYVDNPQQKLRYIVLNAFQRKEGVDDWASWGWAYEKAQRTWLDAV